MSKRIEDLAVKYAFRLYTLIGDDRLETDLEVAVKCGFEGGYKQALKDCEFLVKTLQYVELMDTDMFNSFEDAKSQRLCDIEAAKEALEKWKELNEQ